MQHMFVSFMTDSSIRNLTKGVDFSDMLRKKGARLDCKKNLRTAFILKKERNQHPNIDDDCQTADCLRPSTDMRNE